MAALTLIVCVAIAIGVGALAATGDSSTGARLQSASIALPADFGEGRIQAVGNALQIVGSAIPPAYSRCDVATVDPGSLKLVHLREVACDNLAVVGSDLSPVFQILRSNANYGTVRIAHLDRRTGATILGPIVMTYEDSSTSRPEWAVGPGGAWLYDCGTTRGSELLRFSASSGSVAQRVVMPDDCRMLVAADDDGFWMDEGSNSIGPADLFYVGIHSSRAQVIYRGSAFVNWLVASGNLVLIDQTKGGVGSPGTILAFQGLSPRPIFSAADHRRVPALDGAVVGNASLGFWFASMTPASCSTVLRLVGGSYGCWKWILVHVDPGTGSTSVAATISPPMSFNDVFGQGQAVMAFGSVYFFAPSNPGQGLDTAELYKLGPVG